MRPSEALGLHGDEVLAIIARYPVTNPKVFGSAARGEDTEASHVDILVEPEFGIATFIHLSELEEELENLLKIDVDVLTPGGFSPAMAMRVARDSRLL